MGLKKVAAAVLTIFLSAGLLSSQSLVEAAKKERARRAKIKKKAKVITNADLKKYRAGSAVSSKAAAESAAPVKPPPKPPQNTPVRLARRSGSAEADLGEKTPLEELEEKWRKANDNVGVLTLKMQGLWQEFYSLDDMTPRDLIKQQISQTYLLLQKAKSDEEKLKKQLETARRQKK